MKKPFKMKAMSFGNSPMKQTKFKNSPKAVERRKKTSKKLYDEEISRRKAGGKAGDGGENPKFTNFKGIYR